MTTKPVAPAPAEDTPPWQEPPAPVRLPNPEAAWVAWGNWLVAVPGFDYENDAEYEQYVPMNITIRDGEPITDIVTNVTEFLKGALALGWKPMVDNKLAVFDISKPPVPAQQQASAPLPQAAPQQAKQPWKPGGAPAPVQQQAAPVQQQQVGDNTFVADTLLVANMAKLDGTPYVAHRLKGGRYAKFGVRVWPDKLDAVLPGWSSAPPGEHPFVDENGAPFKVKCTFSWDDKPGKDGTPQPKNVYALELV
jgi:hypothetical protein